MFFDLGQFILLADLKDGTTAYGLDSRYIRGGRFISPAEISVYLAEEDLNVRIG
jgi:hypothetical protein